MGKGSCSLRRVVRLEVVGIDEVSMGKRKALRAEWTAAREMIICLQKYLCYLF